tara:strand:- start:58 stop:438 length:381 start_codon:yes stop_codon:yes gene_type:complete
MNLIKSAFLPPKQSMSQLLIQQLKVATHIGVHAWEKRILQTVLIDIDLAYDFSNCNDCLDNTLDYALLCEKVTHFVENHQFDLIESLAHALLEYVCTTFALTRVEIRLTKPHAIRNARGITVVVRR